MLGCQSRPAVQCQHICVCNLHCSCSLPGYRTADRPGSSPAWPPLAALLASPNHQRLARKSSLHCVLTLPVTASPTILFPELDFPSSTFADFPASPHLCQPALLQKGSCLLPRNSNRGMHFSAVGLLPSKFPSPSCCISSYELPKGWMKHSGGSCEIKLSAPAFFTTHKQDRHNWESKKAKTQNKNPELQYLPSFSHLHWPCCLALAQCRKTAPRTRENHSLARRRKGFWLEIDAKASQASSSPHHSPHAFDPNTKEHCTAGEQYSVTTKAGMEGSGRLTGTLSP